MPDGRPWPRISIVTPSYNQGQFIEETIRSVLLQGYPDLEYVIIDGGSTDESVAIIKKYEPWLAYWVSEKDRGQAHAINKGLQNISGELFNWINSDDLLAPGCLGKVSRNFANADFVVGKVNNFDGHNWDTITNKNISVANLIASRGGIQYHQPGIWTKLSYMKKPGIIIEELHYCFDSAATIQILLEHSRINYINDVLVFFRIHAGSKTTNFDAKYFSEHRRMLRLFSEDRSNPSDLRKMARKELALRRYLQDVATLLNQPGPRMSKVGRLMAMTPATMLLGRPFVGAVRRIMLGNVGGD